MTPVINHPHTCQTDQIHCHQRKLALQKTDVHSQHTNQHDNEPYPFP